MRFTNNQLTGLQTDKAWLGSSRVSRMQQNYKCTQSKPSPLLLKEIFLKKVRRRKCDLWFDSYNVIRNFAQKVGHE